MRTWWLASIVVVGGCAALPIPPEETPYFLQQTTLAQSATASEKPGTEAAVLRDAAAKLELRAGAESERMRRRDETEGLLDVESAAAREFLARLVDSGEAERVLATTTLDLERTLLAAYARNPDVAAARANWAASLRMYEQATYLEDLLLRYRAFTRLATPPVGAPPMRESAFPYPGLAALKGEMIDREVTMAREMTRMRLRDVVAATSNAWHVAVHHREELKIREEQLSLAKRMAETTRSRVASGKGPQAELLEMESEVAMAENDLQHAVSSLARARAELNTLLGRDPEAPLTLPEHFHEFPAAEATPVEPLLEMARAYSPEVRIARAELARTDAAIRMSEAMLFAAPAPGAIAPATPMPSSMAAPEPSQAQSAGAMSGAMSEPSALPSLPPRGEPATGGPGQIATELAWVAEMKERRVALERAAEEAVRAAERRVLAAHYEMDAQRRMWLVAAKTAEPLTAQAVDERMRLYESGRAEFAELVAAFRRHLDAAHDAVAARHDWFMAEAMLWMAIGARPEVVRKAGGGATK